jgi:hypothetical protein
LFVCTHVTASRHRRCDASRNDVPTLELKLLN